VSHCCSLFTLVHCVCQSAPLSLLQCSSQIACSNAFGAYVDPNISAANALFRQELNAFATWRSCPRNLAYNLVDWTTTCSRNSFSSLASVSTQLLIFLAANIQILENLPSEVTCKKFMPNFSSSVGSQYWQQYFKIARGWFKFVRNNHEQFYYCCLAEVWSLQ
jgi:hypothetical protein